MKRFIFLLAALLMLCAANASGTQGHNDQSPAGYSVAQPPGYMVADCTFETPVAYTFAQTPVQAYSYTVVNIPIQHAVLPDANLFVETRQSILQRHYTALNYATYWNYTFTPYTPPVNLHVDPGSCTTLCSWHWFGLLVKFGNVLLVRVGRFFVSFFAF